MSTNGSAGRLSPQSTTEWTSSIRISPLLGILRVRMPPRPIPNRQREIVREFSIMITLSGQSLHPIDDSDSASRTERKGSPRRPPGESEDAALSPYAPKRTRLMREGKPLAIDVPRFLLPPDWISANPGQSLPATRSPNGSLSRASSGPELLGSARPIRMGAASRSSALRLYIEGLKASLRCLKRRSPDLDRPHVDALISRHGHQAAENAGRCARVRGPLEPENLPPALMRAQRTNAGGPPLKKLRGPLLILIVAVAATAYFVTGSSVPPPDTTSEPNLATAGLEATIAPPLLALQSEIQPTQLRNNNPGRQTSQSGEASSNAAAERIFPDRIEARKDDAGGAKRTSDVADSSSARQPRSGGSPASRESKRAIHGIRRCAKFCTGSNCSPIGDCARQKKGSRQAQVPAVRKALPRANPNPANLDPTNADRAGAARLSPPTLRNGRLL